MPPGLCGTPPPRPLKLPDRAKPPGSFAEPVEAPVAPAMGSKRCRCGGGGSAEWGEDTKGGGGGLETILPLPPAPVPTCKVEP